MKLTTSDVIFLEDEHRYYLFGARLSGITSLIHAVKGLGNYPDASDYVKNFVIPRAGEYGTCVHHAIEDYDTKGVKNVLYHGKYRDNEVSRELDSYIKLKEGYNAVANEFTVSNDKYASQIDNVWEKDGDIYLCDTKTNNLDYYPDGEEGLKEYLSWQLNCYRCLFEEQTGLKVKGLKGNWFHGEKSAQWDIDFIDDDKVKELLSTPYDDDMRYYHEVNGERVYYDEEKRSEVVKTDNALINSDAIDMVVTAHKQLEYYTRRSEEIKSALMNAMVLNGVKSWDCGSFKATYTAESTSMTFDKDAFFKAHPEMADEAKKYVKKTTRKENIRLTFRD